MKRVKFFATFGDLGWFYLYFQDGISNLSSCGGVIAPHKAGKWKRIHEQLHPYNLSTSHWAVHSVLLPSWLHFSTSSLRSIFRPWLVFLCNMQSPCYDSSFGFVASTYFADSTTLNHSGYLWASTPSVSSCDTHHGLHQEASMMSSCQKWNWKTENILKYLL